jgi:hypothetical protein
LLLAAFFLLPSPRVLMRKPTPVAIKAANRANGKTNRAQHYVKCQINQPKYQN